MFCQTCVDTAGIVDLIILFPKCFELADIVYVGDLFFEVSIFELQHACNKLCVIF